MKIDTTHNYQNIFAKNHQMSQNAHLSRAAGIIRTDVVEISESAREHFHAMKQQAEYTAHTQKIAQSYEPIVKEIIRNLDTTSNERSGIIAELKHYYQDEFANEEASIISTMVDSVFL